MTHQIRASFTPDTITLYQAYSAEIALAAVKAQSLTSSPSFSPTRTTWLKPSWAWMMYRSGYSHKDSRQAHVLALSMPHDRFAALLEEARLAHRQQEEGEGAGGERAKVVVQWDPERDCWLRRVPGGTRSIQIGVRGAAMAGWTEWIVGIEDVTGRARELKRVIDQEEGVGLEELVVRGLVPREEVYRVSEGVARRLGMEVVLGEGENGGDGDGEGDGG